MTIFFVVSRYCALIFGLVSAKKKKKKAMDFKYCGFCSFLRTTLKDNDQNDNKLTQCMRSCLSNSLVLLSLNSSFN